MKDTKKEGSAGKHTKRIHFVTQRREGAKKYRRIDQGLSEDGPFVLSHRRRSRPASGYALISLWLNRLEAETGSHSRDASEGNVAGINLCSWF